MYGLSVPGTLTSSVEEERGGRELVLQIRFQKQKTCGVAIFGGGRMEGGTFVLEDPEMGTALSASPRGKPGRGWWKAFGVLGCVSQKQTNEKSVLMYFKELGE